MSAARPPDRTPSGRRPGGPGIDPLDRYRRKRRFDRTSEPGGGPADAGAAVPPAAAERLFVVQKHAARRLHYDLRLQFGEAMKSWAVTRVPSFDPRVRRLAVHVEDHPLAYARFEGAIPKGEYGAGHVLIWDRGTWVPMEDPDDGYARGVLKFRLDGERLAGGWTLVRIKGKEGDRQDNWLLIKERDLFARDAPDDADGAAGDAEDLPSVASGMTLAEIRAGVPPPDPAGAAPQADAAAPPRRTPAPRTPAGTFVRPEDIARIWVTNPDRVMFGGPTKLDLALYYARAGDWILAELAGRPLTLVRCPTGEAADCFFQRHPSAGMPAAVRSAVLPGDAAEDGDAAEPYLYLVDAAGLLALPQFGVVELHAWGCRIETAEQPDRLVFDLDPDEALDWADVAAAAHDLRRRLADLGLKSFLRTTGGKGLHLVVPLAPARPWAETFAFAEAFTRRLAAAEPRRYTANLAKRQRTGRIFVDYLRNRRGATAIASYSPRARPGVPVATPIAWEELDGITDPRVFDWRRVPERLADLAADPWQDLDATRGVISQDAWRAVGLDAAAVTGTAAKAKPKRRRAANRDG